MKKTYEIKGMHCQSCIAKITHALEGSATSVKVTLNPPQAVLEGDSIATLDVLNTAIAKAGDYTLTPIEDTSSELVGSNELKRSGLSTYYPLVLIVGMIAAVSLKGGSAHAWMLNFMAGFFLVFGAFKLLDIKGFRDAYATYDLLAQRWNNYGLIYPFLELELGFAFLFSYQLTAALWIAIVLMGFSSLGVIKALREKRTIRCACLGTVLNLPMSTITLVEDLGMVVMSGAMLWGMYLHN